MGTEEEQRSSVAFSRAEILRALGKLSSKLGEQSAVGELCLFGGTVMVLAFNARVSTKDVDAIFQPTGPIRAIATAISEEEGLPRDWLNDGVKGFVSVKQDFTEGNLPQFPNLRVTMPVPEYLLAMKCMAGRVAETGEDVSDIPDILFLIRHLKLASAAEVLKIVSDYYPESRISVRTRYLVEGLFQEGKV